MEDREEGDDEGVAEGLLLSSEYIRARLVGADDPLRVVDELQSKHGPGIKKCQPVLGMLKVFGFRRFELYRDLFEQLKQVLWKEIPKSPKETLARLLGEAISLIGFTPLEDVVIKILAALPNPPDDILEQLSLLDRSVFNKLPRHTRQLVWEQFPKTFQRHVTPLIDRYISDHSSITWGEEMHPDTNYPPPHKRRQKVVPLQELIGAIGSSARLYRHVVDEVRRRFAESGNMRFCALRSDLLMGLHDISASTILATEPCHDFAWYLDAYVKQIFFNAARESLEMKTALLEKSVVNELQKIISGTFKPGLGSAFASPDDIFQLGAGRPKTGGRPQSGAAAIRARHSKVVDLTSVLLDAWKKIKVADRNRMFLNPVVETYPQLENAYLAVVKRPMDLQTIEDKIRKRQYTCVDDMRVDLHLIAHNSRLFNGPKHKITQTAQNLMQIKAENYLNIATNRLEQAKAEQRLHEQQNNPQRTDKPAVEEKVEGREQTAEEIQRKKAKETEKKRLQDKKAENERLSKIEKATRHPRAISDAAMILASGSTVNALTTIFWFLIGEEVIKKEILPREADTTRAIAWMLEISSTAWNLVLDAEANRITRITPLSKSVKTSALPIFACMMLDSSKFRTAKPTFDGVVEIDKLDESLLQQCKDSWVVRNGVLNFFCQCICDRDRSLLVPLLAVIKEMGASATDQSSFLHSLVTSFYMSSSSHAVAKTSPSSWSNRPSSSQKSKEPPLPPEFLIDTIKAVFLPAVLRASPLTTPKEKTARQHVQLSRLLTLESTIQNLPQNEVLKFCRAGILSLAGIQKDKDPNATLVSPELKDIINQRYTDPSFDRAKRQYEKLFRRFPTFRDQCGLPPCHDVGVDSSGRRFPSPSPSPFITPSPSPSPYAPSPFTANSPNILTGAPPAGPPAYGGALLAKITKRPLDERDQSLAKKQK